MSNTKQIYNLLYLPRGTSDNKFKVESLAHVKVGGNVRVKFSLKHEVK